MLRNFSNDAPLEGRSSFAVEMIEMRYALADATAHSLVLVDELGKATEVLAGTSLAAAMLEQLDDRGCKVGLRLFFFS
jgi:DNA mismatch repair ATPase MutS